MFANQAISQDNNQSTLSFYEEAYREQAKKSVINKNPEAERKATAAVYQDTLLRKAAKLRGSYQGTCVEGARNFLGAPDIKGAARYFVPNSDAPVVGGITITRESSQWHVVVNLIIEETRIFIYESNLDIDGDGTYDGIAGTRWLKKDNPLIVGFSFYNVSERR